MMKRILCILLCVLSAVGASAQNNKQENRIPESSGICAVEERHRFYAVFARLKRQRDVILDAEAVVGQRVERFIHESIN